MSLKHALSRKESDWLKRLSDEIWQANPSPGNVHGETFSTEKRKLTKDEWRQLKALIHSHELPCLPGGGSFGLSFSLTICNHSPSPEIKPNILIVITGKHLPGIKDGHEHWGKIWKAFEPFTHSPRNLELLAFYGFDPPRERSYYEY